MCHVAAQYGQTAFIYHVALRWDADIDEPDVDGRTPLHWAAYKGFADTIRLLLVMDARWSLPDREVGDNLRWFGFELMVCTCCWVPIGLDNHMVCTC